MAEGSGGPDDAILGALARHALHDEELIAAFAADDVDDTADADRARALVERCATCRDLHEDLVGIRTMLRASGAAAERAETLRAPRDFRLTADDAARLRPGTPVARLATKLGLGARIALGVASFGRPVGAALATFGIAGLLLGSVTLNADTMAFSTGAAVESGVPGDRNQHGPEASGDAAGYLPGQTPPGDGPNSEFLPMSRETLDLGPISVLLIAGGAALLVLGVALVLAAWRRPRARS